MVALFFYNHVENNVGLVKKRNRKCQKTEIAYLRNLLQQLNQRRNELSDTYTKCRIQSPSGISTDRDWKAVAQRQAVETQLALQENKKLKQALVDQLQLMQSITSIWKK